MIDRLTAKFEMACTMEMMEEEKVCTIKDYMIEFQAMCDQMYPTIYGTRTDANYS